MQRRPTKNTRGPNADEKRFMAYTKECACIVCNAPGPSIVDHVMGATFKHQKVLIGHWFLLPLCPLCDEEKTRWSRKNFCEKFGLFTTYWSMHMSKSGFEPPIEVIRAIMDFEKQNTIKIPADIDTPKKFTEWIRSQG